MSSLSSKSSATVLGNTKPKPKRKKQISPAKRWCFTLNNYTYEDKCSIVPLLKTFCTLGIIAEEIGEKGTPHLQGYIEFKKKRRPLSIVKSEHIEFKTQFKRIHWEKCKGSRQQNKEYCEKDGKILEEWGFPRELEIMPKDWLKDWMIRILEMVQTPPVFGHRNMYWYYGSPGIGKTLFLKYLCFHKKAVVIDGRNKANILSIVARNQQCEIFVFNLAKGEDELPWKAVELIKDGLFCDSFGTKNKGMVIMNTPHIIVMANHEPHKNQFFHEGKWIITCLG